MLAAAKTRLTYRHSLRLMLGITVDGRGLHMPCASMPAAMMPAGDGGVSAAATVIIVLTDHLRTEKRLPGIASLLAWPHATVQCCATSMLSYSQYSRIC